MSPCQTTIFFLPYRPLTALRTENDRNGNSPRWSEVTKERETENQSWIAAPTPSIRIFSRHIKHRQSSVRLCEYSNYTAQRMHCHVIACSRNLSVIMSSCVFLFWWLWTVACCVAVGRENVTADDRERREGKKSVRGLLTGGVAHIDQSPT